MAYSSNPHDTPAIRALAGSMPHLSSSQRKIASYVLDHIFEVATGGIEELATSVGVSTASVSRFVTCLGYANFSNFKQEMLQAFRPPFARHDELSESGPLGAAGRSLSLAASVIGKLEQRLTAESLGRAVDLLSRAQTVYCMALGCSTPAATIASMCLAPYCNRIQLVEGGGEIALYRLNKINERDAFIVFSFPRYSIDSVRFTRFVKERKARILAITDQPASPLVPLSDNVLYTSSEHSTVPVSLVGMVALVEALTSAMAERFPEKFAEFAAFSHQFVPFHYFEYSRCEGDKSTR